MCKLFNIISIQNVILFCNGKHDASLEDLVQKDVNATVRYLSNEFRDTRKRGRRVAQEITDHLILHFGTIPHNLLFFLEKPGNHTEFPSVLLPQFAKAIIFLGGPERRR